MVVFGTVVWRCSCGQPAPKTAAASICAPKNDRFNVVVNRELGDWWRCSYVLIWLSLIILESSSIGHHYCFRHK
jgi:hypothetical protein